MSENTEFYDEFMRRRGKIFQEAFPASEILLKRGQERILMWLETAWEAGRDYQMERDLKSVMEEMFND